MPIGKGAQSMEHKYLSGNIRERLQDLMKERKITQSELAAKIGMDVSTLSRFISNATGKLGDENIKKIAKEFEVSTDFLLGVTDIPDRMNYDIAELGLSVQAAKISTQERSMLRLSIAYWKTKTSPQ